MKKLLAIIIFSGLLFGCDNDVSQQPVAVNNTDKKPVDKCSIRQNISDADLLVVENAMGWELKKLVIDIEQQYKKSLPDDYAAFAKYKAFDWLKRLDKVSTVVYCQWGIFGRPMDNNHHDIKNLVRGFTDVNTMSIKMHGYLKNGETEARAFVDKKLAELKNLTNKYQAIKSPAV